MSLTDAVISKNKEMIRDGRLVPGSKLPREADLAAVLMSDADALMQHFDALGDDPDIDTLVANDLEFHHMIAVGSGNPVLCSLIDGLSGRTQRARVWRGLTQEDAVTQTAGHRSGVAHCPHRRGRDVVAPLTRRP